MTAPTIRINYTRPAVIGNYKKQQQFIDAPTRYTIVEATTKAGKTVGCIVWLFEQAIANLDGKPNKDGCNYWWVAPVYSQAKIAYRRMKRFIQPQSLFVANESELTIKLINGARIFFKTAEHPDNLYGEDVYACVCDEASRMKEDAWFAIRSTLTATNGKCKIIGNVKGILNWAYELARKAEKGEMPNWSYFKITAADAVEAGTISADELEDARRTYPEGIFLELYYGIPFVNSSNKFAYAYIPEKHDKRQTYNPGQPLFLSFDFNRNPICCGMIQHYDGVIRVLKSIKLPNSDIYSLCDRILQLYPNALYLVTGDATGRNSSALVKDNLNYYTIIQQKLSLGDGQIQVPSVNPTIEDNQVLVNAVLQNYPTEIDPIEADALKYDLMFVEMLADGKIKKGDREDPKQQADSLDWFRYWLNQYMDWFLNLR